VQIQADIAGSRLLTASLRAVATTIAPNKYRYKEWSCDNKPPAEYAFHRVVIHEQAKAPKNCG